MPSHFSTIGIALSSEEEFISLAQRVESVARPHATRQGKYLQWESGVGVELWLQVSPANELLGMNPHFSGTARMKVRITNPVRRAGQTALDGAWHGWADPGGEMGDDGCYPFVFDSPDFHLARVTPPFVAEVQLAAFAHELTIFENEADYNADGEADRPKLAVESCIPSGLFKPGGGETEPPEAYGIFTGRILETERRINPLTDPPFHWALVKTLGARSMSWPIRSWSQVQWSGAGS